MTPRRRSIGDEALDDEALVERARAGDADALNRLLRNVYDPVYGVCRRIAGNDADAADASQEALLAIVRGLPRYDGRARFSTWAYRVATNACLDELRRRKRRPTPTDDEVLAAVARPGGDAGSRVADAVTARLDVDAALATLSPEFRAAVVLRDLCGLDYAEIAEVLDLAPGTVRSRISRGRSAIADHLGGNQAPTDGRPNP